MYSGTMAILELFFPLDTRTIGILFVGDVVGAKLLSTVVGQFVEKHPNVLFTSATSAGICMIIFALLSLFKGALKRRIEREKQARSAPEIKVSVW